MIKKLSSTLPRDAFLTVYKSFVRPHLDYDDIIYDQAQTESFCNILESIQYNAALAGALLEQFEGHQKLNYTKNLV